MIKTPKIVYMLRETLAVEIPSIITAGIRNWYLANPLLLRIRAYMAVETSIRLIPNGPLQKSKSDIVVNDAHHTRILQTKTGSLVSPRSFRHNCAHHEPRDEDWKGSPALWWNCRWGIDGLHSDFQGINRQDATAGSRHDGLRVEGEAISGPSQNFAVILSPADLPRIRFDWLLKSGSDRVVNGTCN